MAWIRLDDQIAHHPKFAKVGAAASWLFVGCLGYAQRYLTDGFIPQEALSSLTHVKKPRIEAQKLIAAHLLEKVAGGFLVHDYLVYNSSASEVKADREWDRFRKELYSQPDLVKAIKQRDANRCRYCGIEVNWSDRRGPNGGQFDHVKPRGPNTLENIVVACRKCNCTKNSRTPEQARMPLIELVPTQIRTESENKDRLSLRARASYPSHPIPSVTKKTRAVATPQPAAKNGNGRHAETSVSVVTRLVHEALDTGSNSSDLPEDVKLLCAKYHIVYNGTVVGEAIDSALFQRRLKQ